MTDEAMFDTEYGTIVKVNDGGDHFEGVVVSVFEASGKTYCVVEESNGWLQICSAGQTELK